MDKQVELEGHNLIKEEASRISSKTKQMSCKEPNTEQLWLQKTPTTLNKTSKNFKRKSMHFSSSAQT